jgi:hypothetical protein
MHFRNRKMQMRKVRRNGTSHIGHRASTPYGSAAGIY